MGLFVKMSCLRPEFKGNCCSQFCAHPNRRATESEVNYDVYSKQRHV